MKTLIAVLLALSSVVIILVLDQYFFCPVYSFTKPEPFSGTAIYNPYATLDKNSWVKCNFHAHVRCWNGITYGHGTAADIHRIYTGLHYGIGAVSNYQFIDTTWHTKDNYISAYEHGCNVLKNHHLVLGAKKVCWKDYYLPQTLSNKQDILNRLSSFDTSSLFIVNHPLVRNGYSRSDFANLTNYRCMEVLNPACNSSVLWDAALSTGKPVFAVGDDDVHNVLDTNSVGRICTWLNIKKVNKNNIINALKSGDGYAMRISKNLMQQERRGMNDSMPVLNNFTLQKNKINVDFNLPANEIIVSGENGRILKKEENTNSISYLLGTNEPYARVTATYNNGTQLYLNPVFRYHQSPLQQSVASINTMQTILLRTAGVLILLFWFNLVFKVLIPEKWQARPLQVINAYKHGNHSDYIHSKNNKVWYRRLIRHVYRFFYNLDWQRKNQAE